MRACGNKVYCYKSFQESKSSNGRGLNSYKSIEEVLMGQSMFKKEGRNESDQTSDKARSCDLDGTDEAPQQIVDKAVQMKKHEEQDIKNCLDLAVACGISRSSHEFFFLTKVFQRERWRAIFQYFQSPEERLSWIQNAYSDPTFLEK